VVYLLGDLPDEGPASAVRDIVQRDGVFTPGALAVRTGTIVRFPNQDPYVHNIFSYADPRFDLGRYPEGESREVSFDEPGIVRIYCEIHEYMRAVVLVSDHSFHAVVSQDGTFRIEGIPPGEYTLAAYHPDLGSRQERVVVPEGGTARVALELGGPQ
jgi:plastocyanin